MTYQLSIPLWLLAGWFVYIAVWTYIFADTRGYWRGRREGYERCDAGWRQSLAEASERMQAVDAAWATAERRAAVLAKIVGGATVNEGTGEAKG